MAITDVLADPIVPTPVVQNVDILGTWTAIVLAGERPGGDLLARQLGVPSKALIQVGGQSMLRRVVDTLLTLAEIRKVVILAQHPEALLTGDAANLGDDPRVTLAASGMGIARSIGAIAGSTTAPFPLLVTTADHPLLTREMVEEFLGSLGDCDLAVGVGERSALESSYPESRRTWLKFADGHYSGANLFALRNLKVAEALVLWGSVEKDRKKAWKLFASFGPYLLLRAVTRSISFPDALARAGKRVSVRAKPVVLSAPEAVIDVDKVADLKLANRILEMRSAAAT